MRFALYQPDIPQNTGTILRLAACWGLPVDIIEPMGFVWDDRKLRRAGMDYIDHVIVQRHLSWQAFLEGRQNLSADRKGRLILLSTKAKALYHNFDYRQEDCLLLGQESSGVPDEVRQSVDASVRIPLRAEFRSLNVALAASIVAGEAMRQEGFSFHD